MRAILRDASRIAAHQHGCITAEQLIRLGASRSGIDRWVRVGLLHREYRGVYRLGHRAASVEARYMAAVLACGPGAALSGPAAAHHYGFMRSAPSLPEVSAPTERDIPGIHTRQRAIESRIWHNIPTATIPQTLQDLAGILDLDALAKAAHEAEIRYGKQHPKATKVKGAHKLRAVLTGDHALLLSEMERAFRRLLAANALPAPLFNKKHGTHYIDARWPDHRLTVELISYRYHNSRAAFEGDHERRRAARRRGDAFRIYTYRDVVEEPQEMLEELAELLLFAAKLH